uniref:Zinc finger protein 865 n=1 Tax=Scophthalmus maximus TaxID=52904 RepID=A0A8D3BEN8_SCOMX
PGSLPLSSLRLIVPPLQLLSAALWQVVKQGAVMYYGLLEEFVSSVLDTVPGLLAHAERVQLVVGLRARVVLECGRSEGFASPQTSSSEVKASVTNFLKLVHTLVDDHCQRDIFYQKIFPTVFGPKYDSALEALMRKFLFNLQKLLPVPNLEQVALLSESNTEPSGDAPLETLSSDSGKRSSRVKKCSVCGQIFTCSADSTRHMRSHIDTSQNFDSYNDCETHEGQCRVSNQGPKEKDEFMLENSSRNSTKRNLEDTLVSVADTPANTRSVRDCKSPLTCKESDNTDESCAETSSDTNERKPETRPSPTGDSQTESCNIKCTMCEKNFSEIVPLRRHYAKSHKVRGSYPCQSCRRTFVRLCELVRHQQNKKLYQCSTCKKCYTKPGLLDDHQKVHAASVTASICETCGKIFKSLTYLILHQSKHREKQPSVCSYCGKQFSTKDCLKAHMVRHTGGYPCPVCGKKFNQKTYLKWHLYKHTGQEPYLCDTCGKGWPSAAQLRVHMVQHTEERPFKCQDCGVCYKRRSHLMAHRSEKHIRLRPFVCEICSKAFRLNNVLKKHMMVHTGERPFTCPKCGKTFTRNTRLREHKEKTGESKIHFQQ